MTTPRGLEIVTGYKNKTAVITGELFYPCFSQKSLKSSPSRPNMTVQAEPFLVETRLGYC